jgi:hypothetical protein
MGTFGGTFGPWAVRICLRTLAKGSEKCSTGGIEMFWAITGGIIYFVLIVTLGVMSLRKGHWVMFIIGIFLPFFWLIGALMPSRRLAY